MRRMANAAFAMLCLVAAEVHAHEAALPAPVARDFPDLRRYATARFTKWWMHVYDATLWTEGGGAPGKSPFALELRYAMGLAGADIVARSIQEMRRLGSPGEARLAAWERALDRIFPDVKPGDRLVGVAVPGREARFYDGRKLLGTVEDAAFVQAFFGIWLDERTSEPGLRRELLRVATP